MIAINYDAQMAHGKLYSPDELFRMAVSLQFYAIANGKTLKLDPDTRLVILE